MAKTIPDILAHIVEEKKRRAAERPRPVEELEDEAVSKVRDRRSFKQALLSKKPAIIAEFKKGSPSRGLFAAGAQVAEVVRAYELGGAVALSVLTDDQFFYGSKEDLKTARSASGLPVLRKDFLLDDYDVIESAATGADAILLIAAISDVATLRSQINLARRFQMDCLVEVHDEEELDKALEAGAEIIGVNNRDLRTFQVDLETAVRLAPRIPASCIAVAESGIQSRRDIQKLESAGYRAFLIGEHLMTSADPVSALRDLQG